MVDRRDNDLDARLGPLARDDWFGRTDVRAILRGILMPRLAWVVLIGGVINSALLLMSWRERKPVASDVGNRPEGNRPEGNRVGHPIFKEIITAPIERPVVHSVRDAGILPDDLVIGVIVDGKARAYRVAAMEGRTKHLVNDVIADTPVSIAYCNLNGCARAYVGTPGTGPLKLRVSGLLDNTMILESANTLFFQKSGNLVDPAVLRSSHLPVAVAYARRLAEAAARSRPITRLPFSTLKPAIMTWKSWIAQHPDTEIYAGR